MATQIHRALIILRLNQVKDRTGLSRSGIYQKMTDGDFPKSISLGLRAVGWLEAEVEKWIQERIELTGIRNTQGAN